MTVIDTPLGDARLATTWLHIECRCGYSAFCPIALFLDRHGARVRLRRVLPRLRCSQCHAKPARVTLCQQAYQHNHGMHGARTGWRIALHPPARITAAIEPT